MSFLLLVFLFTQGLEGTPRYMDFWQADYSHYSREVECYTKPGDSYVGPSNYSWSGAPCIDWQQTDFTGFCVYCRNPDREREKPWCFVNPKEWEYCSIPECDRALTLSTRRPVFYQARLTYDLYDSLNISFSLYLNRTVGNMTIVSVPFEGRRGFMRVQSVLTHDMRRMFLFWVELGESSYMVSSPARPYSYFRVYAAFSTVQLEIKVNDIRTTLMLYNKTYNVDIRLGELWELGGRDAVKPSEAGCISDLSVLGVRPLDDAERLVNENKDTPVQWSSDCLYVKPGNWKPSLTDSTPALTALSSLLFVCVITLNFL